MYRMHFGRHHGKIHAVTAVLLLCTIFLTASTGRSPIALAYNTNPHGVINYCTISNGVTTIHGWAHDPDAPSGGNPTVTITVGTQSQTVKTNVTDPYHNTAINKYLADNWPGAPTGDTYGFVASFASLYKGTAYNVSGIVHNYGPGTSDNNLKVDTSAAVVDGISITSLFNANNTIPDACLNTRPTPPPVPSPPPPPTPTPTPNPPPSSGGSSGGGNTSSGGSTGTSGTPGTVAGPISAADGSVAAGTLGASITIPGDGASSAYILYGTSSDNLDSSTDSLDVTTGNGSAQLLNLIPNANYYYQIIRTDSAGNTGTSATSGFKTAGYVVNLHFIDAAGKVLSGIAGAINDNEKSAGKSNKDGNLIFGNLDAGQYEVTYHYGKLNYKQAFDTDSAGDGSDHPEQTIVLRDTVNVSKLTGGSTTGYTGAKHHSIWGTVLLLLLIIGAVVAFALWRLRRRAAAAYSSAYSPSASYGGMTPDMVDKPTPIAPLPAAAKSKRSKTASQPEHLEHVGESLREMVIQSMHEEAQKRKANRP